MDTTARVAQWLIGLDVLAVVVLFLIGVQGWFMSNSTDTTDSDVIRMYARLGRVGLRGAKLALLAAFPLFLLMGVLVALAG